MRLMAVLVSASLALVACGDDAGDEVEPTSLGDELGCDSFVEKDTEELYVRELFECKQDGGKTDVYTFNSSSARDSWREIAEEFGVIVIADSSKWLQIER